MVYETFFYFQGCTDLWGPKALRSAAGAHFKIPIHNSIPWEDINKFIHPYAQVYLADNSSNHKGQNNEESDDTEKQLEKLVKKCQEFKVEDGKDLSYNEPEILEEFSGLTLQNQPLNNLEWSNKPPEIVVVMGGETDGLSPMATKLAHEHLGAKIHLPLRNNIESLNVGSAASIIMYEISQNFANE